VELVSVCAWCERFTAECYLDADGQVTCRGCPSEYTGRTCSTCAPGYEGNPLIPGEVCRPGTLTRTVLDEGYFLHVLDILWSVYLCWARPWSRFSSCRYVCMFFCVLIVLLCVLCFLCFYPFSLYWFSVFLSNLCFVCMGRVAWNKKMEWNGMVCKNGWSDQYAIWGQTHVGQKSHVLDEVPIGAT